MQSENLRGEAGWWASFHDLMKPSFLDGFKALSCTWSAELVTWCILLPSISWVPLTTSLTSYSNSWQRNSYLSYFQLCRSYKPTKYVWMPFICRKSPMDDIYAYLTDRKKKWPDSSGNYEASYLSAACPPHCTLIRRMATKYRIGIDVGGGYRIHII